MSQAISRARINLSHVHFEFAAGDPLNGDNAAFYRLATFAVLICYLENAICPRDGESQFL
jgi:hypothetical protein